MNKLKEVFFEGIKSERSMTAYRNKNYHFTCFYKFYWVDIDKAQFRYREEAENEFFTTNYTYELHYEQYRILYLYSFVKYDKNKIKTLFKDLILAQQKIIETKETIEDNLNKFKLGIEL